MTILALIAGLGVAFLVRFVSLSPQVPARPVVLASGDWAPFVGPDLRQGGPVAVIVTDVLRRQGYEPQVSYTSWPVALDRAAHSDVLAAFPFIADEERRGDFLVSDPILSFEYVLFYSTDRWPEPPPVEGPDDLEELRIGRIDGYAVWPELDAAVTDFVVFDTSEDAFAALDAGEIDLVPEARLSGEAVASSVGLPVDRGSFAVLEAAGASLLATTENLYLLAPRTDEGQRFVDSFNKALAQTRRTALYRSAVTELEQGGQDEVELVPAADQSLVQLWSDADGGEFSLAPRGARGVVLDWPDGFESVVDTPTEVPRARVKMLNGPSAGRIVWVEPGALRLVG